jgi:hypothetical protein
MPRRPTIVSDERTDFPRFRLKSAFAGEGIHVELSNLSHGHIPRQQHGSANRDRGAQKPPPGLGGDEIGKAFLDSRPSVLRRPIAGEDIESAI